MKSLLKVFTCFILLISFSCDKDDNVYGESENFESANLRLGPIQAPSNPYIIAALVNTGIYCPGGTRSRYTVYASSGLNKVPYDREIHVGISRNNDIIDARILKIPANSTKSENKAVFEYISGFEGTVRVKIYAVLKNNQPITNQFELRDTNPNVRVCGVGGGQFGGNYNPCNGGIIAPGQDNNDEDGDGLCSEYDYDDDGDGIPDISDED
jgi:hypothetical protein